MVILKLLSNKISQKGENPQVGLHDYNIFLNLEIQSSLSRDKSGEHKNNITLQ